MKVKVLNPKTNEIQEIDESQVSQAVQSGWSVEQGKEFNVQSPDGKRGTIQTADLKKALESNFKVVTRDQLRIEDLEKKYDNPIYGAATGFARGLTAGLSDQAVTRSQLLSPEEMRIIKDKNPISSAIGEAAGFIGPLIATGGTSAGAVALSKVGVIPKAVSALGKAAGAAGAAKLGVKTTSTIAQKAIQAGITGMTEGALMGIGTTISEDALGTADFNAESLLFNAGLGAAIGGGIGASLGAATEGLSKTFKFGSKKAREKIIQQLDVPEAQKKQLLESVNLDDEIRELIAKAGENKTAKQAFQNLGIDAPEYMTHKSTVSKTVKEYLGSQHTPAANVYKNEVDAVREKVNDYAKSLLASKRNVTDTEMGQFVKNQLIADIGERSGSAKMAYEALKQYDELPISNRIKKLLTNRVKRADWYRLELINKGEVESVLRGVNNARDIGDITKIRSSIRGKVSESIRAGNWGNADVYDDIYKTLTRIREDAVLKGLPRDEALGAKKLRQLADRKYAEVFKDYKDIGQIMGIKNPKSINQIIDKIESVDDGKIFSLLYNKNKIQQTAKLAEKYPELFTVARERKLNDMFQKSLNPKSNEFSAPKFINEIKKLKGEEKALLFKDINIDAISKDLMEVQKIMPEMFNPSRSGELMNLRRFIMDKTGLTAVKDAQLYGQLKKGDSFLNNYFLKTMPALQKIEQAGNQLKKAVDQTTTGFLNNFRRGVTASTLSFVQPSKKEVDEARDNFNVIQSNPDKLIDDIIRKNEPLYVGAPQAFEAMKNKIISAVSLISEKMPKTDANIFGETREPSRSELMKINEYIKGATQPKKVLSEISSGYINPYALETFKIVYPDTYLRMTESMLEKIKGVKMSDEQKRRIEQLLGVASRASSKPENKARLQSSFAPQPEQQQASNIRVTGAKNLNQSGRSQGGLDSIISRRQT
jgi:hypothetical protein